jgi:hypothetical protein
MYSDMRVEANLSLSRITKPRNYQVGLFRHPFSFPTRQRVTLHSLIRDRTRLRAALQLSRALRSGPVASSSRSAVAKRSLAAAGNCVARRAIIDSKAVNQASMSWTLSPLLPSPDKLTAARPSSACSSPWPSRSWLCRGGAWPCRSRGSACQPLPALDRQPRLPAARSGGLDFLDPRGCSIVQSLLTSHSERFEPHRLYLALGSAENLSTYRWLQASRSSQRHASCANVKGCFYSRGRGL